jgi:hypothetical protein
MKPATVKGSDHKPKRIGPKRKRLGATLIFRAGGFVIIERPYRGNRKPKGVK